MVKGKLLKHDQYVEELISLIAPNYNNISTHIDLRDRKKVIGEIDLVAEKDGRIDVFEVKCSYRFYKARQQLKKVRKYLGKPIHNYYFYCGSSHLLHLISLTD
ncbi:MAG: hypothetical protein WC471_02565 [Candidatus Woesearchaeota archaeon]